MIRTIDIRLNAAHPELPLPEATTYQGAPSTAFLRGVPKACGQWQITAVNVAVTFPDNSTTTRAAVLSAGDVWVVTIPACATSGRTISGLRILADGLDENGDAVTGYVLGVADLAVATFDIAPAPGVTSYALRYFDNVPNPPHKGDVAKVDNVLKYYDGTAWQPFAAVPSPSTSAPLMDGTASAGSSAAYARGDHVHPTDTSRMAATATGADIPSGRSGAPPTETITEAFSSVGYDLGAIGSVLSEHASDTTIHVTAAEKAMWNGKQNALSQTQLDNIAAVPNKANNADVLHNTGGWLVLNANVVGMQDPTGKEASFRYVEGLGTFLILNDRSYYVPSSGGTLALTADLPYSQTAATGGSSIALSARGANRYDLSAVTGAVAVTLPTVESGKCADVVCTIVTGATVPTLSFPSGVVFIAADSDWATLAASSYNVFSFTSTGAPNEWIVGRITSALPTA